MVDDETRSILGADPAMPHPRGKCQQRIAHSRIAGKPVQPADDARRHLMRRAEHGSEGKAHNHDVLSKPHVCRIRQTEKGLESRGGPNAKHREIIDGIRNDDVKLK